MISFRPPLCMAVREVTVRKGGAGAYSPRGTFMMNSFLCWAETPSRDSRDSSVGVFIVSCRVRCKENCRDDMTSEEKEKEQVDRETMAGRQQTTTRTGRVIKRTQRLNE